VDDLIQYGKCFELGNVMLVDKENVVNAHVKMLRRSLNIPIRSVDIFVIWVVFFFICHLKKEEALSCDNLMLKVIMKKWRANV
jgi:hypothetical protein